MNLAAEMTNYLRSLGDMSKLGMKDAHQSSKMISIPFEIPNRSFSSTEINQIDSLAKRLSIKFKHGTNYPIKTLDYKVSPNRDLVTIEIESDRAFESVKTLVDKMLSEDHYETMVQDEKMSDEDEIIQYPIAKFYRVKLKLQSVSKELDDIIQAERDKWLKYKEYAKSIKLDMDKAIELIDREISE